MYDDFEICDDFKGYVWATWTTMAAQPVQIDSALQALLTPSASVISGQKDLKYDLGVPANVDSADQPMGSNESMCGAAAPFPDPAEDVTMDSGVDKRSRESPDSTLKPEGKSLKTSEAAPTVAATDAVEAQKTENVKSSTTTKRHTTIPEAESLMWEVHHRMPAWKADKLIESLKSEEVDLAALEEATGILFESKEMWRDAVQHLEKIQKEKPGNLGVPKRYSCSSQPKDQDQDETIAKGSDDPTDQEKTPSATTGAASAVPTITGRSDGTTIHASQYNLLLSHQQSPTNNQMPTHPALTLLPKIRRILCLNRMKIGLVESQKQDKEC